VLWKINGRKWKKEEIKEEKNESSRTCINSATFERANLLAHSKVQFSYVQRTTMIKTIASYAL
jgi:hypothetical protein